MDGFECNLDKTDITGFFYQNAAVKSFPVERKDTTVSFYFIFKYSMDALQKLGVHSNKRRHVVDFCLAEKIDVIVCL